MQVVFRVNPDGVVELADFSSKEGSEVLEVLDRGPLFLHKAHAILAVQVTGETTTDMHANKHNASSTAEELRYKSHEISENEYGKKIEITMDAPNGLHAVYYMQLYKNISIARVYSTISNVGNEDIGIEYVSSFVYDGISKNGEKDYFDKTDIFVPYNSWSNEAQWQKYDAADIGLSHLPVVGYNLSGEGNNRYHYGSNTSWSTCEYLPMGMALDRETNEIYYFEIDHSGAWKIEYGSTVGNHLYVSLLGPNDESGWWKNLKHGESFTTVPAVFGVANGDESKAIEELTKYRRMIRRKNNDNEKCNVVFNDYMNCLMGDPTEEKEKQIIDKAAALGCEYYCLDCGWYDSGVWWDKVGEWKESPERFPNGLKTVYDYARAKGMKMGMWLEIEVMGTACELSQRLPDDWFFCTHGKRRIDNKRYLLDFRNPDVRKYCMDVVDRLIKEYGVEFFKIDYNVTTGLGSDINSDSLGDAMLEHYRCLYQWYKEIYEKYPELVIENCGSGAQRMDYGILELHSLQSTSDQTDYISNSYIAANVASAVTPEQAGMWVYPYEDDAEHVIYNMVNGMLLRPYVSGLVWNISDSNFDLMKEGISVYKTIRDELKHMVPFFPMGFANTKSEVLAYGVKNDKKAYLSVFTPKTDKAGIPLNFNRQDIDSVKLLYPHTENCEYRIEENILIVNMPQTKAARFFEIKLK